MNIIDVNEAIKMIEEAEKTWGQDKDGRILVSTDAFKTFLKNRPLVENPNEIHAHWITEREDEHSCSHCYELLEESTALEFTDYAREYLPIDEEERTDYYVQWKENELPSFCPNCGAKMDEEYYS